MFPAAGIFGIKNNTISLAVELVLLFLAIIWLSLVWWTFSDARRRIGDGLLVACAVITSLFPFIGTLVYAIVRPPEYLDDVHERALEIQAAEARLAEFGMHVCPYCDYEVEKDFLRCPNCLRKLREPCVNCARPLQPDWKLCPYCEAQIPGVEPTATRRSRRRRNPEETYGGMPPSDLV
jgi:RNA polymerase subunit RPABC4/transcription elongation factor Spt4